MEHFYNLFMDNLFESIFTLILTSIGSWAVIQWRKITSVQLGLQALLRDRLIQGHRYFCEKGSISIAERESFEACYSAYKGLGADGVINDIVARVRALPMRDTGNG